MIIFDIETRPKSIDELKSILPEFDPSDVKTGNLKDQEKIAAKVEAARASYWDDIQSKGALAAETGKVAAIGYTNIDGVSHIDVDDNLSEEQMLVRFWEKWSLCYRTNRRMVGFNSNRFDIPFLMRRSWYLGVEPCDGVMTPTGYVSAVSIDLMDRWQCGDRRSYVKLDTVCRACGIGGKPDDCSGEFFHAMLDDPATRETAIKYLENDLAMTLALARRMGVC